MEHDPRLEAAARALHAFQALRRAMTPWTELNDLRKAVYRDWAAYVLAESDLAVITEVERIIELASATMEAHGRPKH